MTIINTVGGPAPKPIYVEAVEDTPSTLPHTYLPSEGFDYLSSVTVGKDPNLVPENVKKDVTIFGTTGTLENGGGGDCTDIFTVNGISVTADGYIGPLGIKVSDTAVSCGGYVNKSTNAYSRTSVERIYASKAGGWAINLPVQSYITGYFEFTLPEVVGGSVTVPLTSLDSNNPWRHLGAFTARGSWLHGNVTENPKNPNVRTSINPSELYYMELSCDGTNLTFNCPPLSSVSLKVGGFEVGANTNVYSAIYPCIVEVKPI